jgi:hypothetical protein
MDTQRDTAITPRSNQTIVLVLAWLAVGVPLLWGVAQTVTKALALFN